MDQIVIQELDDQMAAAGLVLDTLDLGPGGQGPKQVRPGKEEDNNRSPSTSTGQSTGLSTLGWVLAFQEQ